MATSLKEMYEQLGKENKEIQYRGITNCPDTIVMYKGKIIGKYSHTKKLARRIVEATKRATIRNMKRIDKGEEPRYGE